MVTLQWLRRAKWIRELRLGFQWASKIIYKKLPSNMCHLLSGNPTMISSFFYIKIDSAAPYNSAVHWGILNIQYIAIRAKRIWNQAWMIPKLSAPPLRSLHRVITSFTSIAGKSTDALMPRTVLSCNRHKYWSDPIRSFFIVCYITILLVLFLSSQ